MSENITVKTLAKELNISIATVSKALNDSHEISLETKKKVLDLAKRLKYYRNPAASNLRSQKTKTIAVIIPEVANSFFSLAINGIEAIARKRDYHVLIYQTHENSEIEAAFTDSLVSGRVDGILISVSSSTQNSAYFKELQERIPIVFFDRTIPDMDAVRVTTDDYESTYQATLHLIANGCRKIAYLAALGKLHTGRQRMQGYLDALQQQGLSSARELIVNFDKHKDLMASSVRNLLINQRPDALLSSVEEMVIPAYQACKEMGLNIPRDVKILSFSNLSTATLLNPPLTTITQPAFEIGMEAAGLLFKLLDKKYDPSDGIPVLKSVLIRRESTG